MAKPYDSRREFAFIGVDRRQVTKKEVAQFTSTDYKARLFAARQANEDRKEEDFKQNGIKANLFCF